MSPMIRTLGLASLACLALAEEPASDTVTPSSDPSTTEATPMESSSPLDFTLKAADGSDYALGQHRGKVLLLVNVASKCGLTGQYTALQGLHERFQAQGLVVIGLPANDFNGQEPGTDAEIQQFCSSRYHVTFPVLAKISVLGESMHPLYRQLTTASAHPGDIRWNFAKFLVGRDGAVAARFDPRVKPDDPSVVAAIEQALTATAP